MTSLASLAISLRNPKQPRRNGPTALQRRVIEDLMLDKPKQDRKADDSVRFKKTGE